MARSNGVADTYLDLCPDDEEPDGARGFEDGPTASTGPVSYTSTASTGLVSYTSNAFDPTDDAPTSWHGRGWC